MPSVRLTDRYIKSVSCPSGVSRIDVQDEINSALGLRISSNGKKVFTFRYRVNGVRKRMTLGAYGVGRHELTLVQAREQASLALLKVHTGQDPAIEQPKKLSASAAPDSFQKMAELHIEKLRKKGRSEKYLRVMEYALKRHIYPKIGSKPIGNITKADVLGALAQLDERGQTTTFNRTLTAIRPVFAMAEVDDPTVGIEKYPEKTNDAWFTLDEVAQIWIALDSKDTRAHPMTSLAVKLAILSLKRANEVAGALFHEFHEDIWRIPAERMKGRRLEVVPLTSQMAVLVEAAKHHYRRPQITENSPFVFPSTHVRDAPIESTAMSRAFPRARRSAGLNHHKGTLHSLRHSGATILASNRTSPYIVSALLSHQLAASGVAKVTGRYNMYDLLDERREALENWNRMVMEAVTIHRAGMNNLVLAEDPIDMHIHSSAG